MNANVAAWSLLKVDAVELTDDHFPGWVRVHLVDASGVCRIFEDKVPIFFEEDDAPTPATTFPVPAHIRCEVLRAELDADGEEILVVSTAVEQVETDDGLDEFRVRRDQVEQPAAGSLDS